MYKKYIKFTLFSKMVADLFLSGVKNSVKILKICIKKFISGKNIV